MSILTCKLSNVPQLLLVNGYDVFNHFEDDQVDDTHSLALTELITNVSLNQPYSLKLFQTLHD